MSYSRISYNVILGLILSSVALTGWTADQFPPAWSVGDTWRVKVRRHEPTPEATPTATDAYLESTKVYEIAGEEMVEGRPCFRMKVRMLESQNSWVFLVDESRHHLVRYQQLTNGVVQRDEPNAVAPKDSLVGNVVGGYDTMLDFIVFPSPNVNEDRSVVTSGDTTLEGYRQKTLFVPGRANVTITKMDGPTVSGTIQQVWKVGDKWPESTVLSVPHGDAPLDVIIETLVR